MIDERDEKRLIKVLTELFGQSVEQARIIGTTGVFPSYLALLDDRALLLQRRLGELKASGEYRYHETDRIGIVQGYGGPELHAEVDGLKRDVGDLTEEDAAEIKRRFSGPSAPPAPEPTPRGTPTPAPEPTPGSTPTSAPRQTPAAAAGPVEPEVGSETGDLDALFETDGDAAGVEADGPKVSFGLDDLAADDDREDSTRRKPPPPSPAAAPRARRPPAPPTLPAPAEAPEPPEPDQPAAAAPTRPRKKRSRRGTLLLVGGAAFVLFHAGAFDDDWYAYPPLDGELIVVYSTWGTLFGFDIEPQVVIAGEPLVLPVFNRVIRVPTQSSLLFEGQADTEGPGAWSGRTREGITVSFERLELTFGPVPVQVAAAIALHGPGGAYVDAVAHLAPAVLNDTLGRRDLADLARPDGMERFLEEARAALNEELQARYVRLTAIAASPPRLGDEAQTLLEHLSAATANGRADAPDAEVAP